jgi:OmpA-OmpF porin, OOP family
MPLLQTMNECKNHYMKPLYLLLFVFNGLTLYGQHYSPADSLEMLRLYNQMKNGSVTDMQKNFSDPNYLKQKNTPTEWKDSFRVERNTKEADLMVRLGDIDNFGFGWDLGYDPLSGKPTQTAHTYPYQPGKNDVPPTDCIMVPTGYKGPCIQGKCDGYTKTTQRPGNLPKPFIIPYHLDGLAIHSAKLQMFVDDFQAPVLGSYFRVSLNGKRVPYLESMINTLQQTGPVGKLITFSLDPALFSELEKDTLKIFIDDPVHNIGDGFAIDFIRLLINPKNIPVGNISGTVYDKDSRKPIPGAQLTIGDDIKATTDNNGNYEMKNVPAGLAILNVLKDGYQDTSVNTDLTSEKAVTGFNIYLRKKDPDPLSNLANDLDKKGHAEVYEILFDPGKATIKDASLPVLKELAAYMKSVPAKKYVISGHTDNVGDSKSNLALSKSRAESVVAWLVTNGAGGNRLEAKGYGSSMPIATNDTETGRARNRRVQVDSE